MTASQPPGFFRRLIAFLFVILGVVGLLACLAGIAACWYFRPGVTGKATHACERTEVVLEVTNKSLKRVEASLAQARTDLATVPKEPPAPQLSPLKKAALRQVTNGFVPQLENAGQTLNTVADAAVVLNSLLEGMGQIPLVHMTPLDMDQVQGAAGKVKELGETARTLNTLLDEMSGNDADQTTARIEDGLAQAISRIGELTKRLTDARDQIQEIHANLGRWLTTAAIVLTVLLAWIALGQLCLVLQGRQLWRGDAV
jgi:hypothetical protein